MDNETLARAIAPHLAAILSLVTRREEREDDLVPEADACRIAACTKRTLATARRQRELVAFGKQRSRAYRRADLLAWIESRKVVHAAIDDADLDQRVRRLSRKAAANG